MINRTLELSQNFQTLTEQFPKFFGGGSSALWVITTLHITRETEFNI